MLPIIGPLLSLLPSALTSINNITASIANEKIAVTNAKTEQERIAAQERVNTLQARRDLMIAESQRSNTNAYIRSGIALGPMIYLLKIFIWDKVLQTLTHGNTDPLDDNLWQVIMVVLGFYFLYEGAVGVARIIKS